MDEIANIKDLKKRIDELTREKNSLAARVAILEDILGHVKRHLAAAQGLILL